MKIHMEAVTLLSVLFATSSVLAADDAQQQARQLGRRKRKKNKSNAPSSTPTEEPELSTTINLSVVLDADPIILVPNAGVGPGGPGDESFIGSRSVLTGRVEKRDPSGNDFLPVQYTQICTITKGLFPEIETYNCDISLCLDAPLVGGCNFYKSGGNIPFTTGGLVPTAIATKTGGTGVVGFDTGSEFLTILSALDTAESIDVDLTVTLPRENLERNVMLAKTVPGFCPSEAGGDDACLGGSREDFDTACLVASLFGYMC